MKHELKLYLFGDQTYDVQPHLRDLTRYRNNPVLEDFLVKAYNAIRTELFSLPEDVRNELPRFTCVDDLMLRKPDGKRCVPLDMAVTCMYQLGRFISDIGPQHPSGDNARVLGLCTGSLAAAAVSCSQSTLELIPLAVCAVKVAFRTGMLAIDVTQRVVPSEESDRSWSMIVSDLAAAEAAILPPISKPYISAYMPNGVTVSGPAPSLALMSDSANFTHLKSQRIQIDAPYHAPHLYSHNDVQEIVGGVISPNVHVAPNQTPILSSTGTCMEGGDFETLLRAAVAEILLRPIRWSSILRELQTSLQSSDFQAFRVIAIGTKADQLIYTALKQTSLRELLPIIPGPSETAAPENVSHSNHGKSKLAIIGMSGRFPGAANNDSFWDLLYQGLDVHKPVPALHWDARTHVDTTESRKNTSATPFGCWLDDPAVFDARFFNISPREAPQIDPAQRLALMTAWEAIEQAGIVPDATPSTRRDRVGVFYGVTSNDWMETNSAQNIDAYFIPGGNRAFIPGRINYCFKFSGPSYAVDTACSSSLAGIHLACNSLWQGDIDTAIAGGTNVLTNPDFTSGLDRGHFLSRTGNCKTFDDSADGYCRGEGIGTVILKRLDDAMADNDPILGVILNANTNHSAESESITRPHSGAQREIFSKILNQSAVNPYDISYVEMHGTGTQVGDAGEMASVLDTFAPPLKQIKVGRRDEETLHLGSAKANIGHGEAASGVSSLIKVLLMMQKNVIVPHCGIKTKINSRFPNDLQERNVHIALTPTPWERSSDPLKPRRVFVNNFSAAGGNSAVLLEDAPLKRGFRNEVVDPRRHHLVAVSAKNGVSLQGNLKSILGFLKQNPMVPLGKLSYTTTARRLHHQHRVMLNGSSAEEICIQIETAIRDQIGMMRPKSAPKVLFTFTGQGAQYPGMGKDLFDSFSVYRTEIRRLDQIGKNLDFPSVLPVIQSQEQDIGIFAPMVVQLAGVCMQLALTKLWASWNITPSAVVGHSLGEYAALNAAGVLSDADTIYLVGARANLLQKKCNQDTHGMLVVKASVEEIAGILKNKQYEIACINSPVETVLAGPHDTIAALQELLTDASTKSTLLKVPYAFHSSQIEPTLPDFKNLASGVRFSKAKIPILCPLDGKIVDKNGISFDPEYLIRHSREPVNMLKALSLGHAERYVTEQTTTLEIGPHPAISGMIKAVLGPQINTLASSQRGRPALQNLTATLKFFYAAGADISWSKYHQDFKASHEVLPLPAYSWDLKEYWMQYVNDWSLRKGDPPLMIGNAPTLESTTIHRVVEETGDSMKTHIVVEADIARKDLSPLVQGHEVDGIPLCTPSVYADMALTLGTYLLERYRPEQEESLVDVSDMTISKALILRSGATQQPLQAHAEVEWLSNAALVKFMSFDNSQKLQEHSRCVVRFKDRSLQQRLQQDMANVKQKIQKLRGGIVTGDTARFNRPMVYRAIRPLARFHDDYRAIDEIVLDSHTLEATSRLSYGTVKRSGTYHTHPAMIDSLTQSCGFSMNCNDGTDLDVEVFMNHGWGSFQIFEPLDFDKTYTTYTRMLEGTDKLWCGDVVILDGEKVVAYFGQVAIQGVPRRVLKVVLSMEQGKKAQKQQHMQKKQLGPEVHATSAPATRDPAPVQGEPNISKITRALSIIAEESGLAMADFTDNTVFGDIGIDSLLGLIVSSRLKDELDVDVDFNAIFFDYPTVGELKAFLGAPESDLTGIASVESSSDLTYTPASSATGITTPSDSKNDSESGLHFLRALEIVSEESGISTEDLTDNTNFTDVGVDSLLSLVIVSRLQDELELDVQPDFLFMECSTVGDLKRFIISDTNPGRPADSLEEMESVSIKAPEIIPDLSQKSRTSPRTDHEIAALADRKKAVDDYVEKYTARFSAPVPASSFTAEDENAKVVLVTGASGSLGSHLVDQVAQLPDIKMVVCLNREKNAEPYTRQQKAMRDKGIRTFDKIRPKLLVLQTDSSKPNFGLPTSEYEELVSSVTHLIHNAWPMSAKRALAGFEPQFQIMRNLIDFASHTVSKRPDGFKFSFQMVSSVGVVGHYGLGNGEKNTMVPEDRVDIDSVLPNGYGDAKWGCERMLDETLHKHPCHFRTMAVRLGQIAGSKTSGYWNPMEHFGFLIKSSQMLKALPDVAGTVYWTPVNDIAGTLADLVLSDCTPYPVYHIENPVGQSWREMNVILADALNIHDLIPFKEWTERVKIAGQRNNPAYTLLDFLDDNYLRMSCGGLVLDVKKTLEHSKTLAAVGPVSEEVARKYIHIWREIGFLN